MTGDINEEIDQIYEDQRELYSSFKKLRNAVNYLFPDGSINSNLCGDTSYAWNGPEGNPWIETQNALSSFFDLTRETYELIRGNLRNIRNLRDFIGGISGSEKANFLRERLYVLEGRKKRGLADHEEINQQISSIVEELEAYCNSDILEVYHEVRLFQDQH